MNVLEEIVKVNNNSQYIHLGRASPEFTGLKPDLLCGFVLVVSYLFTLVPDLSQ